ncbi:hypothetical protein EMIHUDRAFT_242176 [Emiliania huxleyi CCMP1516]|uniref:Programmed cell death protein 2 C-terminal domain-containing protein n=2 Tax=Emiliania huxleyi TaxID=2903 RepID=A0A0D3J9V8_EMIH1|nr:hypothetical protein EMIHUDRAFT_242176 [Emiliania huxleyi CCMP1516]EOD20293.1 hypothetical protein EMIHUDRAFT_242176 [Emiliania huxleyi CCMP1516]|eukprot:XP_005772722.1 hypothetical protein EMIHUDRAFT_242176 [Emiliania huxleyi CCMP1516]
MRLLPGVSATHDFEPLFDVLALALCLSDDAELLDGDEWAAGSTSSGGAAGRSWNGDDDFLASAPQHRKRRRAAAAAEVEDGRRGGERAPQRAGDWSGAVRGAEVRHLFAPAVSDEALGAMVSQAEAAPPVAVFPPDETVPRMGEPSGQWQPRLLRTLLAHGSRRWRCPPCDGKCPCGPAATAEILRPPSLVG